MFLPTRLFFLRNDINKYDRLFMANCLSKYIVLSWVLISFLLLIACDVLHAESYNDISPEKIYTIQVYASYSRIRAKEFVKRLSKKNQNDASIVEGKISGRTIYRVDLNKYALYKQAKNDSMKLAQYRPFIARISSNSTISIGRPVVQNNVRIVKKVIDVHQNDISPEKIYTIQVYASYSRIRAKEFMKRLSKKNQNDASIVEGKISGRTIYRVDLNKYALYKQAKNDSMKLAQYRPFIARISSNSTISIGRPVVQNNARIVKKVIDVHQNGFYLEAGVGYILPTDVRQTSNISATTSLSPTVSVSYPHVNDNVDNAISQVVGLGYRWRARYTPISWRAGVRLTHFNSKISGHNIEDAVNYQYNVDVLNLAGDFRITMWILQRVGYYAEASLGFSRLNANNYKLADSSSSNLIYANKARYQFSYGGAVGLVLALSEHNNVDVSVGYYNYGVAKLGEETSPDVTATGTVEESLHALNTTIRYVHYF